MNPLSLVARARGGGSRTLALASKGSSPRIYPMASWKAAVRRARRGLLILVRLQPRRHVVASGVGWGPP